MTSGYSGTPLVKKLGLQNGMSAIIVGAPLPYKFFFDELPGDLNFKPKGEADFIHIFATDLDALAAELPVLTKALKKTGLMWVSWPKGSSSIPTNIKREALRSLVLGTGLVDTKVCAIDDDWSGLKFVYRLKDR